MRQRCEVHTHFIIQRPVASVMSQALYDCIDDLDPAVPRQLAQPPPLRHRAVDRAPPFGLWGSRWSGQCAFGAWQGVSRCRVVVDIQRTLRPSLSPHKCKRATARTKTPHRADGARTPSSHTHVFVLLPRVPGRGAATAALPAALLVDRPIPVAVEVLGVCAFHRGWGKGGGGGVFS
jgi:hypothetical protein